MAAKHGLDRGELRLSFEQCHPTSLVEGAACCQAVGNGNLPEANVGTTWEQMRPNTGENGESGPTSNQDESAS